MSIKSIAQKITVTIGIVTAVRTLLYAFTYTGEAHFE